MVIAVSLALGACQALDVRPPPEIVIPAGVVTSQTADGVAKRMLAEIAASERTLGRSLAQPRIIRIQLLHKDEMYELRHLDGTNPSGMGVSPSEGPGWMVEAIGTFVGQDHVSGQIVSRGTHGFHLWEDGGGEAWGFIPCWSLQPMPVEDMEGSCP
jgi:hypothetical protein